MRGLPAGPARVRRFPLAGGVAALRVPFVTAVATVAALAMGEWEMAIAAAVLGAIAHGVWRSFVLEISPIGLTRGFVLRGAFLGHPRVVPWSEVVDMHTDWCRPGDDTALETTVQGRDGTTFRFSTAMGLRAYWACLAEVAGHLPRVARSGLTDATLGENPPGRRQLLAATRTAGALALVIVALLGVYYVLAQGRSTLARSSDDVSAAVERATPR